MGKLYEQLSPELRSWIAQQHMFFVSTAPLAESGHINCSPKGLDTFCIADANTVAYLDLTGSGAETVAHVRENGRIVLMFCAFEGPPKIVRLHGRGEVLSPTSPGWAEWLARFPEQPSARCVIVVHVTRISDSCGYGVPVLEFRNDRDVIQRWVQTKGVENIATYRREKNRISIDGLPAADFE